MEMVNTPDQIKKSMYKVLDLIKSGNLPQAVSVVQFPKDDIPANAWSLFNKLNCLIASMGSKSIDVAGSHSMDFRGFQMWKKVGRHVKKGVHAEAFILVPINKKGTRRYWENDHGSKHVLFGDSKAPEGKTEKSEPFSFLWGFKGIPVFHATQTEGKEIKYVELKLPPLPFIEVAKFLEIKVIPVHGNPSYHGYFAPGRKEIALATSEESVFFHELAHAVDHYLQIKSGKEGLKGGQQIDQEVVAEFSSSCLAYMQGLKVEQNVARAKAYIERYVNSKNPEKTILILFSRIEGVIEFISNYKDRESAEVVAKEEAGTPKTDAQELADSPDKKTVAMVDKKPLGEFDKRLKKNARFNKKRYENDFLDDPRLEDEKGNDETGDN